MKAVAVIDGEHHAPVVRAALAELPYDVVGVHRVGGTEKLRGGEDYGVPLVDGFDGADVVVDLSDEPVLSPPRRFRLVAEALAAGLPYLGADFRFDPPRFEPFGLPSVAVIGTGKRVGKTAVAGHLARRLSERAHVVVVAMGRGGPEEPELVESPPTTAALLARSRAGGHAASDHLELAIVAQVPTIGCRRAGGGLAGAVATSNVAAGARLAAELAPDVVLFDGSGASMPPVAVDRRVLVVGRGHDPSRYLDPYRVLVSDAVVLVGGGDAAAVRAIKDVPVVDAELRLRPLEPVAGERVAVFTTGPAPVDHLDAEVVLVSRNLADRARLREDLGDVDAQTFVVELKAASIDVVAEAAAARGARLVLAANDVVSPGLDELVQRLVPEGARA
jgi:cyclic 2,3-diphosphoglycerate synthase